MTQTIPDREDRRRELTLWVLVIADQTGVAATEAFQRFERAFVDETVPPSSSEASEYFQIERLEDYLPTPGDWTRIRGRVLKLVEQYDADRTRVDELIVAASPRWRMDRMPVIDRTLLRVGVLEFLHLPTPRPRATINGLIEVAKRFGSESTPAFVNGILDEIRRKLDLPFQ